MAMSPLKQIMDIRRDELPQALSMSVYFFLVITAFWIVKPFKKGLLVQYYEESGFNLLGWQLDAAQAELIAKVLNMFVAFAAATVFVYLARSLRRQQLTYVFSAFSIAGFVFFAYAVGNPGAATVWSFYLFGDLFNTLMVATFFAFLNDSVRPSSAKRIYGLVGVGGVAGGAFGSITLAGMLDRLSLSGWLLLCAGMTAAVVVVAAIAGRHFSASKDGEPESRPVEEPQPAGNPATAGAKLVFSSRYLLAIVAVVGLYEMVSTIMDFQFTSTVLYYLDGDAITAQFATVYAFTNSVALVVQLFLTSFVMTRFGVGTALLFLPIAALLGSVGFMAAPILLLGSFLNTADNGFSYSINQSAKEVLYTPTSRADKYQAKAFIDMFVQRFAKAVAVGLSLAITTFFTGFAGIRWLSIATGLILVAWIQIARFAGREFERRSAETEAYEQGHAGSSIDKRTPETGSA